MFGYITANLQNLSEAEAARYRACYCGLCRTLGARGALPARMTLNYDMCFLVLLLSSLYEPEEWQGTQRCIPHPVKLHAYFANTITEYAADMNMALCYHNCMDDWRDERRLLRYGEAKLLKKHCEAVDACYPRQCGAIKKALDELLNLEKAEAPLDPALQCFGVLMGEIFVYREEDHFSPVLRCMAEGLGRFIYLMDAYEDLEKDQRHGRYNPLIPLAAEADFEARAKEWMTMMLGDCVVEFEKLPLVQDAGLLRNILYSGLWTKYAMLQNKKQKGDAHDPGSL